MFTVLSSLLLTCCLPDLHQQVFLYSRATFSSIKVHMSPLGIWLKCRFGGSRSEVGGSVFLTSSFRILMLLAARTALWWTGCKLFYFLADHILSSDPFPALPAIVYWCCAPWNVAFLRILGLSCLLPICVWGCRTLKYMGDIHSFAQNWRPFLVSSGIEHGCGQFRESLIFTFFHLDVQRTPLLSLRFGDSPGCVLIWPWDVFWLFQMAVSSR